MTFVDIPSCHDECQHPVCVLRRRVSALEAEIAAMKARGDRLTNYMRHYDHCEIYQWYGAGKSANLCTCGLAQTIAKWRTGHDQTL